MLERKKMLKSFVLFTSLFALFNFCSAYGEESKPEEISNDWSAFECYTVSGAIQMLAFIKVMN